MVRMESATFILVSSFYFPSIYVFLLRVIMGELRIMSVCSLLEDFVQYISLGEQH